MIVACLSCGKEADESGAGKAAPAAKAGPGGGAGGPGGAGGFSPERRAQWEAFREQNKLTFDLSRLVRNLGRLEDEGKATLSAKQAKALLPTVKELKAEKKLTQTDCKAYLTTIKKELTADQLQALADMKSRWQGSGGGQGGGPGGGGPGGDPGGPGGGKGNGGKGGKGFDPAAMKDFNPFAKGSRGEEPMNALIAALGKKAGG